MLAKPSIDLRSSGPFSKWFSCDITCTCDGHHWFHRTSYACTGAWYIQILHKESHVVWKESGLNSSVMLLFLLRHLVQAPQNIIISKISCNWLFLQESSRLEYLIPKKTSLRHRLPMADQGFIEFVAYLLEVNPKKRPSALEALKHPWLSFPYEPISSWHNWHGCYWIVTFALYWVP